MVTSTDRDLELWRLARTGMDQVVVRIGSDDWARATPCVEWDVRDLLNHLVGSNLRHITLIAGGSERDFWQARAEEQVLGVDPTADWMSSADALDLAFAEPGAMERTVDYRMPTGRALLHGRVFDVTVHTWDLAEALGAECVLDERLVSACLAGPLAEVLGKGLGMPATEDHEQLAAPPRSPLAPGMSDQQRVLWLAGRDIGR